MQSFCWLKAEVRTRFLLFLEVEWFVQPFISTLSHRIAALKGKTWPLLICYLTTSYQGAFVSDSSSPVWSTHQRLAKLLQIASAVSTCWKWTMSAEARAKAHSLPLWPRSQPSSSLPSAFSRAACWFTSLSQSSEGNRGEVGSDFPRGQDSPNICIPPTSNYVFIGVTRQDAGTGRVERLWEKPVVLITSR